MIDKLQLKNFTAFKNLEIDFSPKINVIVGENGTGKTHLLKAAYALRYDDNDNVTFDSLTKKLLRLFQPTNNSLVELKHDGSRENAQLMANFSLDRCVKMEFGQQSKRLELKDPVTNADHSWACTFIPTKEVLSLVHGMHHPEHDEQTVEWIFDATYTDLSHGLLQDSSEKANIDKDPRLASIIPKLVDLIGGRYHLEDGKFCFESGYYVSKADPARSAAKHAQMYQDSDILKFKASNGSRYSSSMTAEGYKKIGVLHRLLSNGQLAPGVSGPLFWDEPESNLNPKLMRQVVEILLELSRNGQQVIIATHDYVFLKWFDILVNAGEGDHVRFHTLINQGEDAGIQVASVDAYEQIDPNPIAETFNELTKEQVHRMMGNLGK